MRILRLPEQNSGCFSAPGYNDTLLECTVMLCITDAYEVINVKREVFALMYVDHYCHLKCFYLQLLPICTVSQTRPYFFAFDFVRCNLAIFLASAFK